MKKTIFFIAGLLSAPLLLGCGPDDPPGEPICGGPGLLGGVVTKFAFTKLAEGNIAPGFNLDGLVSDGTDYQTCGKVDFTSPDGTPGIDNQLAQLIPTVQDIVKNPVDGLIQSSINDGQLVILTELHGVDDMVNDPEVEVSVQVGIKQRPSIGTDGQIEAYQTFTPDPAAELSHTKRARIEGGTLTTDPFPLAIPIAIFDVAFTIHVQNARMRMVIDEEGQMRGFLGGGILPEELVDGVKNGAGLSDMIPLVQVALDAATDLAKNEETHDCDQFSAALELHTTPAFVRRCEP